MPWREGSVTTVAVIFHCLRGGDRDAQLAFHPVRRRLVRGRGRRRPHRAGPPRQLAVILTGALATAAGPLAWNAILRATHANQFFTDAPLRLLPASWQDTGSGVFALAATAVLLGVGALAEAPTRRTIGLAVLCGLAAFLVDVYLY
jgi:hypothetical protein